MQASKNNSNNKAFLKTKLNIDPNILRLFLIAVTIFVLMTIAKPKIFPTTLNISSMAFQLSEIGILSIGMMLTMLIGGIDLSVNATANLAAIIAALSLKRFIPVGAAPEQIIPFIILAFFIAMAIGLLCGFLNGVLIAYVKIPAILATLGSMTLFTGISTVITGGTALYGFSDQFLYIGNGSIVNIPVPFIIFIALAVIMTIVLSKTAFGLKVYMMGTNPTAAHYSGINNKKVTVTVHMISGLMASLAGMVILARTNSINPDYGSSYVLQAILISVLGGVSVSGGFGTIPGIVLAIISLQFLSTGFNMLLFQHSGSNFFKDFAWGVLLLLVMVINYLSEKRRLKTPNR